MVFKVPQNPVLIIEAPILSHDPSGAAGSAHIHRHTHTHMLQSYLDPQK